jgi:uncharacterized protein
MHHKKTADIFNNLKKQGISPSHEELIRREMEWCRETGASHSGVWPEQPVPGLYDLNDLELFLSNLKNIPSPVASLQTLDELMQRDKKREEDGFPRRIRIGKFIKAGKDKKEKIVVVPTTTEPKFYHDPSADEEQEETTGGSGEGEEGDVIGEQQAQPEQGEGEGQGAGQGEGAEHDITSEAFDLGKILTRDFKLPNLRVKGKKRAFNKYTYELTDHNRGFGQVLEKKETLKKIIETNILLGNLDVNKDFNPEDLVINPQDKIYRILSKEKDFESQAVVFLIRDFSGSMQGKPTEAVVTQHLLIYSWLMYQYQGLVQVRFILHDTEAKEVPDFTTYYRSAVAGGTSVFPSYALVNDIVEKEQLAKDYNIYVFHGTDGDDWEEHGERAMEEVKKMLSYINRMGITIAKNSWTSPEATTVVQKYFEDSGLLKSRPDLIRLDGFVAAEVSEDRIIEGIKKLVG